MIFCKPLIHILTYSYHYNWIIQLGTKEKHPKLSWCLPVLSNLYCHLCCLSYKIPTKSVTAVACNVGHLLAWVFFKGDTLDKYFDWCFWQYRENVLFSGRFLLHMTLDQWCGLPSKETVKRKLRMTSTYSLNKAKHGTVFSYWTWLFSPLIFVTRRERLKKYVTSSNNLIFLVFNKIFSLQRGFARTLSFSLQPWMTHPCHNIWDVFPHV